MEETQAGKDLIEMGSLRTLHEIIVDLLMVKLGRTDKTWQEELSVIKDLAVLKTLYHTILQAKTRKQAKDAFNAVLVNGRKTK